MAFNGRQIIARKSCCLVFKLTGQAVKRPHQFDAGAVTYLRLDQVIGWVPHVSGVIQDRLGEFSRSEPLLFVNLSDDPGQIVDVIGIDAHG
jgi:hypothetical protein